MDLKINYQTILNYEKIKYVYYKICCNTKHKMKLIIFECNKFANFVKIYTSLKEFNYRHGKYNIFLIKYPKYRIIMSENLYDKIVNHLVSMYVLSPLIEPHLLDVNIATRKDKGLDAGIDYIKHTLNLIRNEYDDYYVLKCDIKKFFYNIDHDVLMKKLERILKDKDLLNLIRNIISSTNYDYVNKSINILIRNEKQRLNNNGSDGKSKEKIIKKLDNIPLYQKNKGLPIGNMTSQILAIFYLNDLDHYIKEVLHIKYYIRYMDDFLLFHKDKKYLKYCENRIKEELLKLKLTLNDKTEIIKLSNGLLFLGYRFINKNNRTYILMNKSMRRKLRKRYKKDGDNILYKYNGYLTRCLCNGYKRKIFIK